MCNCCICNLCGTGPGIYGFKVKDWQMACPQAGAHSGGARRRQQRQQHQQQQQRRGRRPRGSRLSSEHALRLSTGYVTLPLRENYCLILCHFYSFYIRVEFFLLKCFTSILLSKQVINSWYTISVSIKVTWTNRWVDKIKVVGIRWPEYNLPRA